MAISVLFEKSEKCYAHHFYQVVKNYPFKKIDELKQVFPGNTSDFEVDQLNGFNIAVEILLNEREKKLLIRMSRLIYVHLKTSGDFARYTSKEIPSRSSEWLI